MEFKDNQEGSVESNDDNKAAQDEHSQPPKKIPCYKFPFSDSDEPSDENKSEQASTSHVCHFDTCKTLYIDLASSDEEFKPEDCKDEKLPTSSLQCAAVAQQYNKIPNVGGSLELIKDRKAAQGEHSQPIKKNVQPHTYTSGDSDLSKKFSAEVEELRKDF